MSDVQIDAPDFDKQPEGAAPADPNAPLEVANIESRHTMRLDSSGALSGYGSTASLEGDAGLMVEFYPNAITGEDHIKINIPGEKLTAYDYRATDGRPPYWQRFSKQWQQYKNAESQFEGQSMIRDTIWIDEAMRAHLAEHRVYTLEQLAAVSDTGLASMGAGARALQAKAIQAVDDKKAAAEGSDLRKLVSDQMRQIQELRELIEADPLKAEDLPPAA